MGKIVGIDLGTTFSCVACVKGGKPYVCGNDITIADYLDACFVTIGEVLRCDYSHLPNVTKWLGNMKKLPSWNILRTTTSWSRCIGHLRH